MSPEAMEFAVIVVSAILIISVIFEVAKIVMRRKEERDR